VAPTLRILTGVLLLGGLADASFAWGPTGHRATCRVAERHLNPQAAKAVAELLAPEALAYVGTWADEIRAEPDWAKAESWHWVTVPDGQTYEAATKNTAGDVLEAIGRFEATLADRNAPRVERVQALKWLAHLLGDLHQPLHVGRGDDRGGNETVVLWFGEPSNLHSVWDSKVIEQSELSFSELAELVDRATPDQAREWQRGGPRDWAAESQQLRDQVYAIGDRRLSFKYVHDAWPIVQRRILQGGLRLAAELNRLLGAP
jgi:S1/P1 Nuclease